MYRKVETEVNCSYAGNEHTFPSARHLQLCTEPIYSGIKLTSPHLKVCLHHIFPPFPLMEILCFLCHSVKTSALRATEFFLFHSGLSLCWVGKLEKDPNGGFISFAPVNTLPIRGASLKICPASHLFCEYPATYVVRGCKWVQISFISMPHGFCL